MADIPFFEDSEFTPRPREEIRLEELTLEPYPDGRRVRVNLRITPFGPSDRPNLTISVTDEAGAEVASMQVIESMHYDLSMTIHLRDDEPALGAYHVNAIAFYEPDKVHDSKTASFEL